MFKPELAESKANLQKRCVEVMHRAETVLKNVRDNETGLKDFYEASLSTLDFRLKCLHFACHPVGGGNLV